MAHGFPMHRMWGRLEEIGVEMADGADHKPGSVYMVICLDGGLPTPLQRFYWKRTGRPNASITLHRSGFTQPGSLGPAGGLLHRRCTLGLTCCQAVAGLHFCGTLLAVARTGPLPGDLALWCPDFPQAQAFTRTRDRLFDAIGDSDELVPADHPPELSHDTVTVNAMKGFMAMLSRQALTEQAPVVAAPLQRHVFVCTGKSCMGRQSEATLEAFKEVLKAKGLLYGKKGSMAGTVLLTSCGSMGLCAVGPAVMVYPEGVWYYGVQPEDVPEIVESHFLGDQPVERLLAKQGF